VSSWEEDIRDRMKQFSKRMLENINNLNAEKMIETNAINPILVKALGLGIEETAQYYVYQRIQRSIVTSFGHDMEFIIKRAMVGERGDWWDVVKKEKDVHYYVSVKSGPNDMDQDQVDHFSMRAKKVMKEDKKAYPFIGMGYGKSLWPIIKSTLKKNELDPEKYAIFGKKMYELITGDPNHYKKLLGAIEKGEEESLGEGKTVLDLIEDKITEITKDFKKKYKNINELLADTF